MLFNVAYPLWTKCRRYYEQQMRLAASKPVRHPQPRQH